MKTYEEREAERIEAAVNEYLARPVAIVLPAEPGWRSLIRTNQTEEQRAVRLGLTVDELRAEDPLRPGEAYLLLTIVPLPYWGIDAPLIYPDAVLRPEPEKPTDVVSMITQMFDVLGSPFSMFAPPSKPAPVMWPLDQDRKRIDPRVLIEVITPEETDEQAVVRFRDYLAKKTAEARARQDKEVERRAKTVTPR